MQNKNKKLLDEFVEYCNKHPEQRFWQALRNWSGWGHILVCQKWGDNDTEQDTYYWEEKDK